MKANKLILTIVASIILSGWLSGASGNYPRKTVIDTVSCMEHPEQTYSLYLPPEHGDPPPLLVFLEPGGRGRLPVSLYRGLAQQYGFILACSNNGRNGPPELFNNALDAMIADLVRRFGPDTGRIVLCGFSGGGRYASLYSYRKLDAGVIACGAGMSPLGGPEQLDLPFYTGIAGRMDMNYLEVTETVQKAGQYGTPVWMVTFDGGHDWPDSVTFRRALEQVLVQWHTKGLMKLDSLNMDRIRLGMYRHLDSLLTQKRHHEAELTKDRLKGHPLFDPMDPRWLELADCFPSGREKKKNEREWQQIRLREKRYQDSIVSALDGINLALYRQMEQLRTDEWWKNRGRQVRRTMDTDETLLRESAYRMYDITWRNLWSLGVSHLGDIHEPEQAARYFRAWCSFEPESPIAYYWMADAYARLGQEHKALKALETAIDNGFSNPATLENTRSFNSLRNYGQYQELLRKMKNH